MQGFDNYYLVDIQNYIFAQGVHRNYTLSLPIKAIANILRINETHIRYPLFSPEQIKKQWKKKWKSRKGRQCVYNEKMNESIGQFTYVFIIRVMLSPFSRILPKQKPIIYALAWR